MKCAAEPPAGTCWRVALVSLSLSWLCSTNLAKVLKIVEGCTEELGEATLRRNKGRRTRVCLSVRAATDPFLGWTLLDSPEWAPATRQEWLFCSV